MGNIVRVVTKDRVYSIGHRLPVPEGCPVEPFFITIIQIVEDDSENELIEFTCTPDEEAATEVGLEREPDISDTVWEGLCAYREQAKQALDSRWMIVATIPKEDARIEMLITSEEYMATISEPSDSEESRDAEVDRLQEKVDSLKEQVASSERQKIVPDGPKEELASAEMYEEQALPPELSVTTP